MKHFCLGIILFAFSASHSLANAAESADLPVIKIGMSAPLSGPNSSLGNQMKAGAEAYFNQVNKNGGPRYLFCETPQWPSSAHLSI